MCLRLSVSSYYFYINNILNSIDIKKISLSLLCYLALMRTDVKNEILENGITE